MFMIVMGPSYLENSVSDVPLNPLSLRDFSFFVLRYSVDVVGTADVLRGAGGSPVTDSHYLDQL